MELRFRSTERSYHHGEPGRRPAEDVRHPDKPPLTGGDGTAPALGRTAGAG